MLDYTQDLSVHFHNFPVNLKLYKKLKFIKMKENT